MTDRSKILLVGGSGFLGNEIGIELVKAGYQINLLSRKQVTGGSLGFPAKQYTLEPDGSIPDEAAAGVAAVINLAGESISNGRWTEQKQLKIVQSRIDAVARVNAAAQKHQIATVIGASAIGYYGDTGATVADELSASGKGFLAETVIKWEQQAKQLAPEIRRVTMRIGVVLGTTGGALPEMMTPYVIGLGAAIGSGGHYLSWVHAQDVCRFVRNAIENNNVAGEYNLTAPNPVTYQQLHEALVAKFGGFKWLKIPGQFFKLALGKKSELLLTSQRVVPRKATEEGFKFDYPTIELALDELLGSGNPDCAVLEVKQWVPADCRDVWSFFCSEKNLEKLTPPFLKFRVEAISTNGVEENSLIDYKLKIHGVPVRWKSRIKNFNPTESFQDIQLKGPYRTWHHTHDFRELGGGTLIRDFIKFKVPLGLVGGILAYPFVKNDIAKIFKYRRKIVSEIFSHKEIGNAT